MSEQPVCDRDEHSWVFTDDYGEEGYCAICKADFEETFREPTSLGTALLHHPECSWHSTIAPAAPVCDCGGPPQPGDHS